jgi:hypothetical protein
MRIFTALLSFALSFFISNVALAATSVPGGDLSGDTTWTLANSPYVVTSDVNVPAGVTLNIEGGVLVKFTQPSTTLNVEGTLNTFGRDLALVIFTSYKDDSIGGDTNGDGFGSYPHYADWRGVNFLPGSVGNITYTGIYYAGQFFCPFSCFSFPSVSNYGGIVTLDHVGLAPGAPYIDGLGVSDGSTLITNSSIVNARYGILISGGALSVHGSTIAGLNYALRNESGVNVDATNNWWGNASGPQHDSNPSGTGARVLGDATVIPFLSSDPFAAPPSTSTLTPSLEDGFASDVINPTIEPNTGNASTTITFKVVYTNLANQAPVDVRTVIAGDNPDVPCQAIVGGGGGGVLSTLFMQTAYAAEGDGCAMDVDTLASSTLHDGNYANGEQYTIALQLPVGNFTYHFEAGDMRYPEMDESALAVNEVPAGCTEDCNSNVLFLPGLEASRLYRPTRTGETGNEKQLWEPTGDTDVQDLFLDVNGKQPSPWIETSQIYTKDVIDEAYIDNAGPNIYKSFLTMLGTMKNADHAIADYSVTPYDWRLSLEEILSGGTKTGNHLSYLATTSDPYIMSELRRLVASSRNGKVTIIAHSNGGLVAKLLLKQLADNNDPLLSHIDKLILVASPQFGTPEAVGALLFGLNQGIPANAPVLLSKATARTFAENSPGANNLLPSSAYFGVVHDSAHPLVSFDNSPELSTYRSLYGQAIGNSTELHNFLLGYEGRLKPAEWNIGQPNVLNSTIVDAAAITHSSIDSWTPPSTMQVYQIAGWGNETLAGFKFWMEPDFNGFGTHFTHTPDIVEDGDGTVVVPSALAVASSTNVSRWWVNYSKYNSKKEKILNGRLVSRDHKDILEVQELNNLIRDLVKNESVEDLTKYTYISTSTPISTDEPHRLHYILHSPLSLNLYDNLGNHTGIATTTGLIDNAIPGAYYREFGEVKYISAPASTTLHLVMNGQASGIFTLEVNEVDGDTTVASTTFLSIPTSTSTKATMDFTDGTIANASSLIVDEDGNDTTDFSLAPKVGDFVTLPPPDLTPPVTVASVIGTLGTNGWYNSNIVVTLTATDLPTGQAGTGSGVASTSYSLNGGVSWASCSSPLIITNEGSTTILYYSTDKVGNIEATKILPLKIDKIAPEAQISVSTSAQDVLVEGTDNFGATTVTKDTSGNVTIADQAGHTTKLFFTKTFSGKILTYAKLTGVQYDTAPKITLPSSSFLYVWDTRAPIVPLSQTIAVDGTYLLQASYDKKTNKTIIIVLKKNLPVQTTTFTGLRVVKLTTNKGVVVYSW